MSEEKRDYMTDLKICSKASPGPWWNESGVLHAKAPNWTPEVHSCCHPARAETEEDADFIALARTALPWYIRKVMELEEILGLKAYVDSKEDYGTPETWRKDGADKAKWLKYYKESGRNCGNCANLDTKELCSCWGDKFVPRDGLAALEKAGGEK